MSSLSCPVGEQSAIRRTDWFSNRRDFFIRQAVEEFFRVSSLVQQIQEQVGPLLHGSPDNGQKDDVRNQLWRLLGGLVGREDEPGPLWRLKDLCHNIWPREQGGELQGRLFDWLIGSSFHETMKLKENIYLLREYARDLPINSHGGWEASAAHDMLAALRRDACHQLEGLNETLGRAALVLRRMLPDLAANGLVPRLLLEEEELATELWNESLDSIWADMYDGRVENGYCAAGASYMSGQWYRQALATYRRALSVNPRCHEALARQSQIARIIEEHGALLPP